MRIMEIAQRHITEFIDDKYTDFEQILEMEAANQQAMSSKMPHVIDPYVVDVVKEMTFSSKHRDGYPQLLEVDPFHQYTLFGTHRVGVLDFLEGLSTVAKLEASLAQSLAELCSVHMPEHGFAVAALERALVMEARARLKILKDASSESYSSSE